MNKQVKIRNAATIILIRDAGRDPHVLMGQRGAKAAFMPGKFVFPGGAVDAGDADIPLAATGAEPCLSRLGEALPENAPDDIGHALLVAAIRELWEETGQVLGVPGTWPATPPADWVDYAATGHKPSAEGMAFVCRAITPIGRPRRFDARFFVIDASKLVTDPDDFSAASDELSHLQWIPFTKLRSFDLPFITQIVLAEVGARLPDLTAPPSLPFFKNSDEESLFLRLGNKGPLEVSADEILTAIHD